MYDRVLIESLTVASSKAWPKIIERYQFVTDYLEINMPTTADVDRFAQHVGLSRRMFYRLIEDRKRQLIERSSASPVIGRGRPIDKEQELAISDALANHPADALLRDICIEVLRICEERGIKPPSAYAIASRMRIRGKLVEIDARLHYQFDWVLDAAQLDFDIIGSDRVARPAYLLAVIDARRGVTLAHQVHGDKPRALDIINLISSKFAQSRSGSCPKRVAVTRTLWAEVELLVSILCHHSIEVAECAPRTIRSGEALMLVFGGKIGNISLQPRPRRRFPDMERPAIEMALAEAIVGIIVQRQNEVPSSE